MQLNKEQRALFQAGMSIQAVRNTKGEKNTLSKEAAQPNTDANNTTSPTPPKMAEQPLPEQTAEEKLAAGSSTTFAAALTSTVIAQQQ